MPISKPDRCGVNATASFVLVLGIQRFRVSDLGENGLNPTTARPQSYTAYFAKYAEPLMDD